MFADQQGDQFTYKIWIVDKNDNLEDGRELTQYIFIPRVRNHKPATFLLALQYYEQLQFEPLSTRCNQKTTKMMGKHNRKRAAYKA